MRKIILVPAESPGDPFLQKVYDQAVDEAVELYIVSAYLTNWALDKRLNSECKDLTIVVGTDFGITRKAACRALLKWLPVAKRCDFLAADDIQGFHPKLATWQARDGKRKLLLGSSNLTVAAFSSNYEANIVLDITASEFSLLRNWVNGIRERSWPVNETWIKKYKERKSPAARKTGVVTTGHRRVVSWSLPTGRRVDLAIRYRRRQIAAFAEIATQMKRLIRRCSAGTITNSQFYDAMWDTWAGHESRFMGDGFQIKGKDGDWHEACGSLARILTAGTQANLAALDRIVIQETDRLTVLKSPVRGSWFTEMLSHFFPERYPLIDKPVRAWLRHQGYSAPRKATPGMKYLDIATRLRLALRSHATCKARDLAELDAAIWRWYAINKSRL